MFTVIMWSISIPDDSSVRKVEQTHHNHTISLATHPYMVNVSTLSTSCIGMCIVTKNCLTTYSSSSYSLALQKGDCIAALQTFICFSCLNVIQIIISQIYHYSHAVMIKKGYVHILYSPPLCTNSKSMLQQTTTQYLNQWYFDNNQTPDVTHLWFLWTHTVTQRCKPTSMPVDILSQSRYCTSLAH